MAEVVRGRERELQAITEFFDAVTAGPAGLVSYGRSDPAHVNRNIRPAVVVGAS